MQTDAEPLGRRTNEPCGRWHAAHRRQEPHLQHQHAGRRVEQALEPLEKSFDEWLDGFKECDVREQKDGRAFVPGKMLPGSRGKRNANSVESIHALVYDFDAR